MESSSDSFLRACGSEGPLALSVIGPSDDRRVRITIDRPFAVVGRHARAAVSLEAGNVDDRHAYFQVLGGRLYCVDFESRSGVRVGHVPLANGWLNPGKFVRVGPYHLSCNFDPLPTGSGSDDTPRDPLDDEIVGDAAPTLTAEILVRNVRQSTWRMDRRLVLVGRSALARLRLLAPDVSRFHCSLVSTPTGTWVVDLLGRGGISWNGEPTSCARIEDGGSLLVGCYEIRFRLREPPNLQPVRTVRVIQEPPLPASPFGLTTPAVPLAALASVEASELGPALRQFAMMQQQMMDQFQQTTMMVMQLFARMHHDQMGLVRQELDGLRQLTQELLQTQHELATSRPATPGPPEPPARLTRTRPAPERGGQPEPLAAPPPANPAEGADQLEAHSALLNRIASLQQERQTVLQRILGSIIGR